MPTILTHPAVPVAMAVALGRDVVPRHLLAAGIVASILPDLDVLAFRLGVPYADVLGHRGFSHSLLLALGVAFAAACLCRLRGTSFLKSLLFLFVAASSHGILDAFTDGGMGVAFLWPWSDERFFAPVRMIEVSPISVTRFLSGRGASVLLSELLWVWLPLLGCAYLAAAPRRGKRAAVAMSKSKTGGMA